MNDDQVVAIIAAILGIGDRVCGQLAQTRNPASDWVYDTHEELIEQARWYVESAREAK